MSEASEPNEPPENSILRQRAPVHPGRKLAAGFMLASAAIVIGALFFLSSGTGQFLPNAIIQALLAIYILRGSARAVKWALLLITLGAIIGVGFALAAGDFVEAVIDFVSQVALPWLLSERPGRNAVLSCSIILFLSLAAEAAILFFDARK